ncbi:MAG TPA: protein kinase [Streptosporangiaceae bacterium]|nr:protein kinase [Streptosporangiaceae bacterium]
MSEDFPALAGFRAGSLLAGYRLEAQVGAGGFAVVFRARDQRLDRTVALKILTPTLTADPAFRRRFIAESRAAAAVDDPHIIPVHEAGEADGVLFIAMRFVQGGDLRRVLDREGALAPGRAAEVISPVASALDAAHAAGLVHRDVKPANILVDARPGRPDHVYLSDFGVSKGAVSSVSLTGTGQFLGTPDYSAPEQIEGRGVDGRTDQYALACVAYQILTGEVPFERDQGMAVLLAHLSAPPPSLVSQRPDLPEAADRVLARGLAKAQEQRFGSCGAFADALREALDLAPYHPHGAASTPGPPHTQIVSPPPAVPAEPAAASSRSATATAAPPVTETQPSPAPRLADHGVTADLPPGPQGPPAFRTGSAGSTAPAGGTPARPAGLTPRREGTLPLVRRRRWRLAGLAAVVAAAVAVPLLITLAKPTPGTAGPTNSPSSRRPSGRPSQQPIPPPTLAGVYSGSAYRFNGPNSITADGSHVWVLDGFDGQDGSVTELDARTGAFTRTLSSADYGFKATFNDTAGIIDDGTHVWVGNENSVTEINAGDGSFVRTVQVPAGVNLHGWFTALVRAGTRLWAVTPDTCRPYCDSATKTGFYASVVEFNVSDGSYVRAVTRNTLQTPLALASDGAHLWLVGSNVKGGGTAGTVTEFNADGGTELWSVPTTVHYDPQATTFDSLAYADGRLWMANGDTVIEYNASTGKLMQVLAGTQYKFDQALAIAVTGDTVLVVNAGANSLTEIDARTGRLLHTLSAASYHFDNPAGITVNGNHAWIINSPRNAPGSVVELTL